MKNEYCPKCHKIKKPFSNEERSLVLFLLDAVESAPDKISQILMICEVPNGSSRYNFIINKLRKLRLCASETSEIFNLVKRIRGQLV